MLNLIFKFVKKFVGDYYNILKYIRVFFRLFSIFFFCKFLYDLYNKESKIDLENLVDRKGKLFSPFEVIFIFLLFFSSFNSLSIWYSEAQ